MTLQDVQTHYQKAVFDVLLTNNFDKPLESGNVIYNAHGYSFTVAQIHINWTIAKASYH